MRLSHLEVDRIVLAVIASNTPSYLMKRLRNDPAVQRVARMTSVDDLVAAAQKHFAKEFKTPAQLARAYLILGATSFLPPSSRERVISAIDTTKIEWGRQLLAEFVGYETAKNIQAKHYIATPQFEIQCASSSTPAMTGQTKFGYTAHSAKVLSDIPKAGSNNRRSW